MSRIQALAAACGAAMLISAGAAHADARDPGLYVSGGGSFTKFEGENGVDVDAGGVTARAGVQLNSWLSLEGDATFGVDDGNFDFSGSEEDFNLDDNSDGDVADVINAPGDFGLNYMVGAYARAGVPVSDRFELYGRAGYAYADVDSTITTPGGNSINLGDSESGASYGAGAAFYLTENQSIRLDYTYTDLDLANAKSLGVMYQLKF